MTEDARLLHRYAQGGPDAQDAFAAIVRTHADWMYAVARRRVGGDRQLAEDVTQAAFIVLAEKGRRLPATTPLAPWLFRVTCFAASRAVRDESRRRRHETHVAAMRETAGMSHDATDDDAARLEQLRPALDRAVERLSGGDRHAVLLRFYQQLSLAEVGRRLGVSEDAARKRVARAIDRLRQRLISSGAWRADVTPSALAAVMVTATTGTGEVATAHVAAWTATSLGAQAASATSNALAKGAMKMILWNQSKAAALAVLTIVVVVGGAGAALHAALAQSSVGRSTRVLAAVTPAPTPTPPSVETIQSQRLLMAISPDKQVLAAFAIATGEWKPLPNPTRPAGTPPTAPDAIRADRIVVAEYVGTYRDATHVYGFSGVTGTWDSVAVTTPIDNPGGMSVAQNVAAFVDGQRVHAFSAAVGKWDTLTLPAGEAPDVTLSSDAIHLRHAKTFHMFSLKTGKWTEPPFQNP